MKHCLNCGKKVANRSRFCPHCGAKVEDLETVGNTRVQQGVDGKYRWAYEVNLYTNPSVLSEVLWVMGISTGVVFGFIFLLMLFEGDASADAMLGFGKALLITAGVVLVVSLLGYYLWALVNGGRYLALFTMDDAGITHSQHPRHVERAQKMGMLTALVGLLARKPSVMGAGMLSAARTEMSSEFDRVRRVKAVRRRNLIKVNERFGRNRVFVADADFDFVYDFIRRHCPQAKS